MTVIMDCSEFHLVDGKINLFSIDHIYLMTMEIPGCLNLVGAIFYDLYTGITQPPMQTKAIQMGKSNLDISITML